MSNGRKMITVNRKAKHDYLLMDRYDAGMVLKGAEIKSIRQNSINLKDGFVQERDNELWLMNVHISPYKQASKHYSNLDPERPRKLLLNRREINQIIGKIRERGFTVIPTAVYLENGRAKVEIALARGKKKYDKRQDLAKRDAQRNIERALRDR